MNPSAIVKPSPVKYWHKDNIFCLFTPENCADFSPKLLDADYWQHENAIVGTAQGRGITWFIAPTITTSVKTQWVLKHYFRGGLIGKLIKDGYFFTGFEKTRAVREFSLLQTMMQLNLPVPAPIACRVIKDGIFYRADLLTTRIEQANDLVAILSHQPIDDSLWFEIGKTVAKFHAHGIYHHDLNAHNILIDNNKKVWVIDFDRGAQKTVQNQWQQSNLNRLLRSFEKESAKISGFHWQDKNWQILLAGYQKPA